MGVSPLIPSTEHAHATDSGMRGGAGGAGGAGGDGGGTGGAGGGDGGAGGDGGEGTTMPSIQSTYSERRVYTPGELALPQP